MRKKGIKRTYHVSREGAKSTLVLDVELSVSNQFTAATAGLGGRKRHVSKLSLTIKDLNGFRELDGGSEGSSVTEITIHGHLEGRIGGVGDLDGLEGHGRVVEDKLGNLGQDDKEGQRHSDGNSQDGHDGAEVPVLAALVEGAGGGLGDLVILFELLIVFITFIVWEVAIPVSGSTIGV